LLISAVACSPVTLKQCGGLEKWMEAGRALYDMGMAMAAIATEGGRDRGYPVEKV